MDELDAATNLSKELRDQLYAVLAGREPSVQGGALADMLATWIAGHAPPLREEILTLHIATVRQLIPVNARDIAERHGLKNWL